MALEIKPAGRIVIIGVLLVLGYFGYRWYAAQPKDVTKAAEIGKVVIPTAPEASLPQGGEKLGFPTTTEALNGGLAFTISEMAWQSQTSINFANGGARTTKGSLYDKAHLDISIVRNDDCMKTVADYAKATADGTGYVAIFMGSGAPNYIRAMTNATKQLGEEAAPIIFATTGRSWGEDQVIGDIKYKTNPQLLRGAVCVGYMLDGDQDLAIKFSGDNGIPVNPDASLYDPNALNLAYCKDFLDAVVKYNNTSLRETRHIVLNGRTTGKDTSVGYDLVATWTPGDVNAVQKGRGGATIISTRIYGSIMPNVLIASKGFLNKNRDVIVEFIKATAKAGDQVRSFEDTKKYAAGINAKIWNEESAEYWYKLYNGFKAGDAYLGGSMVYNMADISNQFGLKGTSDIYKEVYNTFGKLQSSLYPKELPDFVPYGKAVDKSFMMSALSNSDDIGGSALVTTYADKISNKVASKAVHVNFQTGSSIISPSSYGLLDQLYSDAVTAEGLKVGIYGYTDNTGNPQANLTLSDQRAAAVRNYLIKKGLSSNRVESTGYGEENPVSDNTTAAGKAANRRVEIVLGN